MSITLRLAGLTAAIAVALALTSAADAKPLGSTIYLAPSVTAPVQQAATGPVDWPGDVGTPAAVPLSVSTAPAIGSQSGFNWSDAMLGALAAFAITLSAAFALGMMRSRGGIALRS